MAKDYLRIYHLEQYLFQDVARCFDKTGNIDPVDFYMIIIWKSVRAKTKTRDRLIKLAGSFAEAVKRISKSLRDADGPKHRLGILMKDWGFRLATATAILTVLYPGDFTVYDTRVCGELRAFEEWADRRFTDGLWLAYQRYKEEVNKAVPGDLSLRDKDRYLWGRSFHCQAADEIAPR